MTTDNTQRALAAYAQAGGTGHPDATEVKASGRRYVVLRDGGAIVAVYRVIPRLTGVRNYPAPGGGIVTDATGISMTLKRMKRWPKELEDDGR